MKLKAALLAGVMACGLGAGSAGPVTFKYAFQGDLNALDGYSINETFTFGALGNVMEGRGDRGRSPRTSPTFGGSNRLVAFHLYGPREFARARGLSGMSQGPPCGQQS